MNYTVGFVNCLLQVPQAGLGSMAQGSRAGTLRKQFQSSMYNLFCLLVHVRSIFCLDMSQVLREEIGTAMRQIKSRTDQFSLTMHGQEGEGQEKEAGMGNLV